jgi:hypothetical protein
MLIYNYKKRRDLMLDELKQNSEIEIPSSDYTVPKKECFNEDGTIDKYKYLLQFPNYTKHERKMTKKIINKFLDYHSRTKYFRLEKQGTAFGVNFVFPGNNYTITERQKKNFIETLWECIDGTLYEVKNFNFGNEDKSCIEIWGTMDSGEPVILYLYPNLQGTIEIKDED